TASDVKGRPRLSARPARASPRSGLSPPAIVAGRGADRSCAVMLACRRMAAPTANARACPPCRGRSILRRVRLRSRTTWWLLSPLLLFGIAYVDKTENAAGGDYRLASREPVGLAPDPRRHRDAVVQVYAARAVRWRGYFGVHTWIAAK